MVGSRAGGGEVDAGSSAWPFVPFASAFRVLRSARHALGLARSALGLARNAVRLACHALHTPCDSSAHAPCDTSTMGQTGCHRVSTP